MAIKPRSSSGRRWSSVVVFGGCSLRLTVNQLETRSGVYPLIFMLVAVLSHDMDGGGGCV